MRLQNLMNVLLNDTVADPSAMEAKVRAQMAERVTGHVEANAARKLTPEQKAEKRRRKYAEDTSAEVHVAVYRAGELGAEGGKARYQIDVNAQQWNLSGLAVLHPECNVVIAEGGPKAQRRFRRLMLHRIRWRKKAKSAMEQAAAGAGEEEEEEEEEESDSEDDEDDVGAAATGANATCSRTGACALVWTGVVPKARFATAGGAGGGRFTFEAMRSEALARNHLAKLGMEAYWDMCRAYRPDTEL
jgi:U4/U6 small nuclear ribonucleoprotein PRP3